MEIRIYFIYRHYKVHEVSPLTGLVAGRRTHCTHRTSKLGLPPDYIKSHFDKRTVKN